MPPKEKIPSAVRNAVWSIYIADSYTGQCFCCNLEPITKANYECGHVISEKFGGKIHLSNLRPICSTCNKSIGTKNMEDFMENMVSLKIIIGMVPVFTLSIISKLAMMIYLGRKSI